MCFSTLKISLEIRYDNAIEETGLSVSHWQGTFAKETTTLKTQAKWQGIT